jgi:hypothetical protein
MAQYHSLWGSYMVLCFAMFMDYALTSSILLLPNPWISHVNQFQQMGEALVSRGHTVFIALPTHYPNIGKFKTNVTGLKCVDYVGKYKDYYSFTGTEQATKFDTKLHLSTVAAMRANDGGDEQVCLNALESEELDEKIEMLSIDLAIIDAVACTRCFYILAYRHGIPYISFITQIDPWLTRTPALPSFVPSKFSSPPLTQEMSFSQRLHNAWTFLDWISTSHTIPYLSDDLVRKYAKDKPSLTLNQLASKSLVWFLDTNVIIDFPRPMMANEIAVGGLSAKPAKTLPVSIQSFMESAKEGVVLISLGSISYIPEKYMLIMLDAVKQLSDQYHIVFRYTFNKPDNIPGHIKLLDWVPQNDILAHSKTRLFITHCGANSQFEGMYHGVPMINIPLYSDQHYNAKRADYHGFSETLDIQSFTAEDLMATIQQVLSTNTYVKNIQKASNIFRSEPMSPREKTVYWVEHVLEFGGAHLRSHALDMPWYEFVMLDLLLFLTAIAGSAIILSMLLIKMCISWISSGKIKGIINCQVVKSKVL